MRRQHRKERMTHVSQTCQKCHNLADSQICDVRSDKGRDLTTLCVVGSPRDVMAIEDASALGWGAAAGAGSVGLATPRRPRLRDEGEEGPPLSTGLVKEFMRSLFLDPPVRFGSGTASGNRCHDCGEK